LSHAFSAIIKSIFELDDNRVMDAEPTGPDFLGESSFGGNVARIRFLLSVGVSPNAPDRAGFCALHRCAVSGNVGAAETLLSSGATVDVIDAVSPSCYQFCTWL
jgi:ankyrin repeat protein